MVCLFKTPCLDSNTVVIVTILSDQSIVCCFFSFWYNLNSLTTATLESTTRVKKPKR